MSDGYDFLARCTAGAVLRTRDRREATITRIDHERGLLHGEVTMLGLCAWRRDGVYSDAPFGAPGPLDLVPPTQGGPPAGDRKRISISEALTAEARPFCCD
jgi:hypothetical protein